MTFDERNGFPPHSAEHEERLVDQNMGMLDIRVEVGKHPTPTDQTIARATVATAGLLQALAAPSGADNLRETDLVTCLRQGLQATTAGTVTREAPLSGCAERWARAAAADLGVRTPDAFTAIEAKWIGDSSRTAWAYVLYDIVKLAITVASGTATSAYLVIGGRLDRTPHEQIEHILQGRQWDNGALLRDDALWHSSRGTSIGPPEVPTSVATLPVGRVPIHVADEADEWSLLTIAVLASSNSWTPSPVVPAAA